MAVGTATALTSAAGLGLSAFQAISGNKRAREAQRELNDYERQGLTNAFKDVPISTVGSDFIADQTALGTAAAVNAAQNGGARTIIGALPGIVAANNNANREGQIYLDDQVNKRNYAIAQDNQNIRAIQEQRDNNNIAALSSEVDAGRQDFWSGLMGAGSTLAYGARNLEGTPREAPTTILPGAIPQVNFAAPQITASPYPFVAPPAAPTPSPYADSYGGAFDPGSPMYNQFYPKF